MNHQRSRWRRWICFLLVAAAAFAVILKMMVFFERSMIFFPDSQGFWDVQEVSRVTGRVVQDCFFETEDKVRQWLARSLAPFFDSSPRTFIFGGYIWYLLKE